MREGLLLFTADNLTLTDYKDKETFRGGNLLRTHWCLAKSYHVHSGT